MDQPVWPFAGVTAVDRAVWNARCNLSELLFLINDKVSVKSGQLQLQCAGQKVLIRLQPERKQLLPLGP